MNCTNCMVAQVFADGLCEACYLRKESSESYKFPKTPRSGRTMETLETEYHDSIIKGRIRLEK